MNPSRDISYNGCTLQVRPQGRGVKVFIVRPGNMGPLPTIPSTMEFEDEEACIAEAKLIVDKLLAK
jgi:hypothetical protein